MINERIEMVLCEDDFKMDELKVFDELTGFVINPEWESERIPRQEEYIDDFYKLVPSSVWNKLPEEEKYILKKWSEDEKAFVASVEYTDNGKGCRIRIRSRKMVWKEYNGHFQTKSRKHPLNNQIITITPPMFLENDNKEQMTSKGHRCSSCQGKGCSICGGSGKLDAVITIEWLAHK